MTSNSDLTRLKRLVTWLGLVSYHLRLGRVLSDLRLVVMALSLDLGLVSNFLKHNMTQDSKLAVELGLGLVFTYMRLGIKLELVTVGLDLNLFLITYDLLGLALDDMRPTLTDLSRDPGLVPNDSDARYRKQAFTQMWFRRSVLSAML